MTETNVAAFTQLEDQLLKGLEIDQTLADLRQGVATQITARREQLGLNKRQFAALLGDSPSNSYHLETGERTLTMKSLVKIAQALRCRVKIQFEPLDR